MLIFLLITLFFIFGTASIMKLVHFASQRGQILDKAFRWQDKLQSWAESGKDAYAKWGGFCEVCFCAFWSVFGSVAYILFLVVVGYMVLPIWAIILWIPFYWSLTTVISLYFVTKLFSVGDA